MRHLATRGAPRDIDQAVDKKLLAVMGGGLLVGGGVFGWYVLYGDKMVARDAARKPIEQWEEAWHHTRKCLLGDQPAEADVGDTLAIRAMEGKLQSCSLAGVGPPEMQGTGIDEIEDAWEQIRTAWNELSSAQPDPGREAGPVRALDAAEAKLREGAGMDPLPPGGTRALPTLVLSAVVVDGASRLEPRGHVLVGDTRRGWMSARSASDVSFRAPLSDRDAVMGWPDPSWAAMAIMPDEPTDPAAAKQTVTITAGVLSATGELTGEVVAAKGQFLGVAAAIGGGATRTIFARVGDPQLVAGLAALRTTDGGAHWSKPEPLEGSWIDAPWRLESDPPVMIDPSEDGGAFLFFDEHGGASRVPTPSGLAGARACMAGGAVWYVTLDGEVLARASATEPPVTPIVLPDGGVPVACTADAVALRTNEKVYRCTRASCDPGMTVPGSSEGYADVFDGGGVVFAMQRERLIGVWRNGVAPAFVRAPAGAELIGVVVWGKTPTFALATDKGLRFAPMP
jgi:hypothetical protein